jgi:methionyl-tRNA formyltransferase
MWFGKPSGVSSEMRIEFLTQDDPLYILPFFEEFLRDYAQEFDILQISCSPMMGKRSRLQMLKELTALYGPVGMGRLIAATVSSRIMAKLPSSRKAARSYGLEQIARAYRIPCKRAGNPNAAEFVESVRQRGAEVLVSVACPYILKDALLSVPPRGCVNIHHAPLPRYKGMMPTFWQMYHGEKSVGVTVHFMASKVDEGQALLQDTLEIRQGETLHELIQRTKRHGAHCMARALRAIDSNSQSTRQLNGERGSYFTFPTIAEIRDFHRRGHRSI